MDKINRIELVLENCESLVVDYKGITSCHFNGIVVNCHVQGEDVFQNKVARYATMNFINLAHNMKFSNEAVKDEKSPMDRFLYGDITSIVLIYEDGTEEQIYIPYAGDYKNLRQRIKVKKNSHLDYIYTVSFDKKVFWWYIKEYAGEFIRRLKDLRWRLIKS